ncbi:MAG: hypothetical protein WBB28_02885 [Crinalium sp.]
MRSLFSESAIALFNLGGKMMIPNSYLHKIIIPLGLAIPLVISSPQKTLAIPIQPLIEQMGRRMIEGLFGIPANPQYSLPNQQYNYPPPTPGYTGDNQNTYPPSAYPSTDQNYPQYPSPNYQQTPPQPTYPNYSQPNYPAPYPQPSYPNYPQPAYPNYPPASYPVPYPQTRPNTPVIINNF